MLSNLPYKIFALVLAIFFWIFVVSIENTILELKDPLSIAVFNQSVELAISSELPRVQLTVRTSDGASLRTISAADFEAFIDLRDLGAGVHEVPVSVHSKNPEFSVFRAAPGEISVTLEPIRQKSLGLSVEVIGRPADGMRLLSATPLTQSVRLTGAESLVARVGRVVAILQLTGSEREDTTATALLSVRDREGLELMGLTLDKKEVEVSLTFAQTSATKQVGVRPRFSGSLRDGVVESIEVSPAVVDLVGETAALAEVSVVETQSVDLKGVSGSFEKKVALRLPSGVSLASGQSGEVTVKVEVRAIMPE